MFELQGKTIITENEVESEQILRMAVAQGYALPKGLKALVTERIFRFVGSPYKTVAFSNIKNSGSAIRYVDIFGDEDKELDRIVRSASQWCMTHQYPHIAIRVNDETNAYCGKAFVSSECGSVKTLEVHLKKPIKVTMDEIEKMFGCPIEII